MIRRFTRLVQGSLWIVLCLAILIGCSNRKSAVETSAGLSDSELRDDFFGEIEEGLAGSQPNSGQGPEGSGPGGDSSSPFDLDFESAELKGLGASGAEEADPTKAWIPQGFRQVGDGLAMRWLQPSQQRCEGKACVPAEVISRDGCPRLYLSVAFLDGENNKVSYADVTEKNLKPFVKKMFTFRDGSGGQGRKVSLEESICR